MMTAASMAPTTTASNATALTPPSSSYGNEYSWNVPSQQTDNVSYNQNTPATEPSGEGLKPQAVRNESILGSPNLGTAHVPDTEPTTRGAPHSPVPYPSGFQSLQQEQRDPNIVVTGNANIELDETVIKSNGALYNGSSGDADSVTTGLYGSDPDDVSSKWIHRDKLARIESEELQAAGIVLPKNRSRSKPRRDAATDKTSNHRKGGLEGDTSSESKSRKTSGFSEMHDNTIPGWDLRLPEEIEAEAYFVPLGGARGVTRIPVAKLSPAPIPVEHMERDTLMARGRDNSMSAEDSITYQKTRSRSGSRRTRDGSTMRTSSSPSRNTTRSTSDISPKKQAGTPATSIRSPSASGPRKASSASKSNSGTGRPKTRNGTGRDGNSGGAGSAHTSMRPGEREFSSGAASKQPEGDPPWMISAYRPDPRLPPDQQLLPTVAKRLQQEKWEREGKFGNIYDKEFRPLTDDGFLTPPETTEKPPTAESAALDESAASHDTGNREWPLKPETRSSSSQPGRTGSYSTIPKIQDKSSAGPIPSPRGMPQMVGSAVVPTQAVRDNEEPAKGTCGCCVIM